MSRARVLSVMLLGLTAVIAAGCAAAVPDPAPTPRSGGREPSLTESPPPVVIRGCGWHVSVGVTPTAQTPPLVVAVLAGEVPVVAQALRGGADPDVIDASLSTTALAAAAMAGCREVIRLLLDAGADPHLIAPGGGAPLKFAVNLGDVDVVKMLLAAKADPSRTGGNDLPTPLHEAAGVGRMNLLKLMIPYASDLDAGRDPHNDPLAGEDIGVGSVLEFVAGLAWREEYVPLLLDAGATPTVTALHRAVLQGSTAMVVHLLSAGVAMSAGQRRSMARVAIDAGHTDIARLLQDRA